jgi:excisionase family DNA binding protein
MAIQLSKPVLPDEKEIVEARKAFGVLKQTGNKKCIVNAAGQQVKLSKAVLNLLLGILDQMSKGNAVQIVPIHAELTTQEAADLLNVSRPYLVKLLENKQIPFHYTGKHRRIHFRDLMRYKQKMNKESFDALQQLAAEAQELGLGY